MRLEPHDLSVIVTGGARGIGAAIAKLLCAGGAHVVVADILDEEGRVFCQQLGPNAVYAHLDVTQVDDWRAAVELAESRFGRLNAVINNAGIVAFASVVDCTPEDFKRVVDINLFGVFLGIHLTAPALRRAGGGVIVNVSSTAGLQGYANIAAYVSSKWGVRGLTKAAALDLAVDRIRVVSLHPGPIRTPMTNGMGEDLVQGQPIPRYGEPEEVAAMARFLLCEASFSTGSEFVVDGGAGMGHASVPGVAGEG